MNVLQQLATEARAINAANGWGLTFGENGDQEIPGYLALIHSEITEAWTAHGIEEAVRELGDVIVRCLDLCELLEPGALAHTQAERYLEADSPFVDWNGELLGLHALTSEALEVYRKATPFVPGLLTTLVTTVQRTMVLMRRMVPGVDPVDTVREILAANRKRAYRHGGRRT